MPNLAYLQPVNYHSGEVEFLAPLSEEEVAEAIVLANQVGYTSESSIVDPPPWTDRIRLNDTKGEGYHRDYFAILQ